MLGRLPSEILMIVIKLTGSQRDLKNLSQVSKQLHALVAPILYEEITIIAKREADPLVFDVKPFLRCCSPETNHLEHVKKVVIQPYQYNHERGCLHDDFDDFADDSDFLDFDQLDGEDDDFSAMSDSLIPFFENLKNQSLTDFTWEIGTCVPNKLLGLSGILIERQSTLQKLRLVTSPLCQNPSGLEYMRGIRELRFLKDVSWIGVSYEIAVFALGRVFQLNCEQLEHIHLEFDNTSQDMNGQLVGPNGATQTFSANYFAEKVLELTPGQKICIFPSLETLYLRSASFSGWSLEMAHAFNFNNLKSLHLDCCRDMEKALIQAIDEGMEFKLTSLTLRFTPSDWINSKDLSLTDVVVKILESFQGLKDFSLNDPGNAETTTIWRALAHHESSLRRLLYNRPGWDPGEDPYFSPPYDLTDFFPSRTRPNISKDSSLPHPISPFHLECLSLDCYPVFLMALLKPLATSKKASLKIIHIRSSGVNMEHRSRTTGRPLLPSGSQRTNSTSRSPLPESAGQSPKIQSKGGADEQKTSSGVESHSGHTTKSADSVGVDSTANQKGDDSSTEESGSGGASHSPNTQGDEEDQPGKTENGDQPREMDNLLQADLAFVGLSEVADWLFGPTGVLSLQILAFGDFSQGGRYMKFNYILRRTEPGHGDADQRYRVMSNEEAEDCAIIRDNLDFLTA